MDDADRDDTLIGGPGHKGWPQALPPLPRRAIAAQRWNLLRGDLPLPLAVIGHEGGTVLVSLNGLTLLAFRRRPTA